MRWHVCIGGYPNGWEDPVLRTDNHELAIATAEDEARAIREQRIPMTTVAIFDDRMGEGEPLSPETVADRVADEEYERDTRNYAENRDRLA
jgi:hypothetical protein